jgi:mitochondrial intermembrane space import and assembly protein 40
MPGVFGVFPHYIAWSASGQKPRVSQLTSPSNSSTSPPLPPKAPPLSKPEPEPKNDESDRPLEPSPGGSSDPASSDDEDSESFSEREGEGAFNPVTGEINWDCPCLGGMAHGVCGPQFREAFSCFVFSDKDPKGIDCVEKFKGMQDCFREHPDVYGDGELFFGLDELLA